MVGSGGGGVRNRGLGDGVPGGLEGVYVMVLGVVGSRGWYGSREWWGIGVVGVQGVGSRYGGVWG